MNGYLIMSRRLLDFPFYRDHKAMRLFEHILMIAAWKDHNLYGVPLKRGQFLASHAELAEDTKDIPPVYAAQTKDDKQLDYILNNTIKRVTDDIGKRFNFNTAISAVMELVNELYRYKELEDVNMGLLRYAAETAVLLLSPFVPHICEEMWEGLGMEDSLYFHPWPQCDESALVKDTIEIVVQVNGRVREKLDIPSGLDKEGLLAYCMEQSAVKALTEGRNVVKTIAVPGKLLNIVVK